MINIKTKIGDFEIIASNTICILDKDLFNNQKNKPMNKVCEFDPVMFDFSDNERIFLKLKFQFLNKMPKLDPFLPNPPYLIKGEASEDLYIISIYKSENNFGYNCDSQTPWLIGNDENGIGYYIWFSLEQKKANTYLHYTLYKGVI
jgi:hypothetical protein